MFKSLFILLSLFSSNLAFCVVPVDGMVALCEVSPTIKDSVMPSSFSTSNNLAIPDISGFYEAEGQKITLYGRVMDGNCTPLSDAKIYVWQANAKGYIQYPHKHARKPKWLDPNFIGTGIANSDNMGRFDLITIMPGSLHKDTAHINIMVTHPTLKTLYTKIYFPVTVGDKIIDSRPILNSQKAGKVSAILSKEKANIYTFDITMPGKMLNKGY